MQAGVGVSILEDPQAAAEEAVGQALVRSGGADAALVFATPGHSDGIAKLLPALEGGLGTGAWAGATAHGVIGRGQEFEGGSALVVAALSGIDAEPFLLTGLDLLLDHLDLARRRYQYLQAVCFSQVLLGAVSLPEVWRRCLKLLPHLHLSELCFGALLEVLPELLLALLFVQYFLLHLQKN